jgi:predicted DNA-binding transcriptional regulator AlpA
MGQTRREWVQANVLDAKKVAAELGVSLSSVYVYRHQHEDFPAPVLEHGRCLMWLRSDIKRWKRQRGR